MRTPSWSSSTAVHAAWDRFGWWPPASGRDSRRAGRFAAFGPGSLICFPWAALYGEGASASAGTRSIGPYASLSAGMVPGQPLVSDRIVTIGDRCVIGRGTSVVGHLEVEIGDDVFTGPNVYITDQNHACPTTRAPPIGRQAAAERPVRIGAGSWLGAGAVVLPGVTIGRHVVVGAGSSSSRDLPDHVVAVGSPARAAGRARGHAGVRDRRSAVPRPAR